jgi:hypothetical protein
MRSTSRSAKADRDEEASRPSHASTTSRHEVVSDPFGWIFERSVTATMFLCLG